MEWFSSTSSSSSSLSSSLSSTTTPTSQTSISSGSTSSSSSGSIGGIRGWLAERSARKEKERYMEQMERWSNMETFTLSNYKEELQRGLNNNYIASNISFMQTKEIKMAKELVNVVDQFIDVVGPDANADDLIGMDRLQRLKVATSSNKTVEDIAILVSQITNMDVLHKALRKRKLEGKPIPPDQEAMQAAIKKDAVQVLSKSQKEMMKSRQEAAARRMARKRRR